MQVIKFLLAPIKIFSLNGSSKSPDLNSFELLYCDIEIELDETRISNRVGLIKSVMK